MSIYSEVYRWQTKVIKKKKEKERGKIVRQVGGLAASYFVSKYLAEIIPVCRKSLEKRIRERKRRKRKRKDGPEKFRKYSILVK